MATKIRIRRSIATTPTTGTLSYGELAYTEASGTKLFIGGSSAVQEIAGDSYAKLASPTFTGTPNAPTAATGTNSTQIATTAFTQASVSDVVATFATSATLTSLQRLSVWTITATATATLPAASTCTGLVFKIFNASTSSTSLTVPGTINGSLILLAGQCVAVESDGTNWQVLIPAASLPAAPTRQSTGLLAVPSGNSGNSDGSIYSASSEFLLVDMLHGER